MTFQKDAIEMRKAYCELLMNTAATDDRIVVFEADLMSSNGTAAFFKAYPDRAFNMGIAEANMVGVAAGMAACGKLPFLNTFTAFATRRCYDQIDISAAYTHLPLRIVGTDPGLAAEANGGTHMSMEDVAIMRSMPEMAVFEPTDAQELRAAWPWILSYPGPIYIRLFRKNTTTIFPEGYSSFVPGKPALLAEDENASIALVASGLMVKTALETREKLAEKGISSRVLVLSTLKPLDKEALVAAIGDVRGVVTLENGTILGGLGSTVCEVLSETHPLPVRRIGVTDHFGEVGKLDYLMEKYSMTSDDALAAALAILG